MKNDKILIPNFLPSGYTIDDAKKRNENGICGYRDCDNKLSNPPKYGYAGIKICDECRKPIDELDKQTQLENWERTMDFLEAITEK